MAGSDHRPLLYSIQNVEGPKHSPFRFQNMWVLHLDFLGEVKKVWITDKDKNPWINLWRLQKNVASQLKKWNWNSFGNVNDNLKAAKDKVLAMEIEFQRGEVSEKELHKANEELLMQIMYFENFLKQKAAVTKFTEGDRNSSYYHACINYRRKCNMILSITDSEGNCFSDAGTIAQDAEYVQRLELTNIPLEGEIKAAFESIDGHKEGGPNGFTAKCYTNSWSIISGDFIAIVQAFFKGVDPPRYFTASTITLIPKNQIRKSWGDFRPISLTNVVSKVISKIIVTRLQPHLQVLISNKQVAFVKGRNIADKILLAQELLLDLDRNCRGSNVIFKLDIKKAYDSINWDFILEILAARGFFEDFRNLIRRWLNCNNHSMLINEQSHGLHRLLLRSFIKGLKTSNRFQARVEQAELDLKETENAANGLTDETTLMEANENLLTAVTWLGKFLKQKATTSKFIKGNRSTKFFHAYIKYKRKCNTIHWIKDNLGNKIREATEIIDSVVQYYQWLMTYSSNNRGQLDPKLFTSD
ncbi:uncharacterized protein LOC110029262 [Phalaenopsis equestris]|uniref:uncharacterized protein LOC110029262 n=1 Tax=Phalaenopsis equestris TaxID=78828 RepID=UPI0009E37AEC|nr:uncharacterized protein LOC110029262 [Phalaenopsis equestris]